MKNSTTTYCTILIALLFMLFTNTVNAQDSKIKKVLSDIIAGKNTDAKKLLDVLDSDSRYQSDLYFWYARTLCYKNIALASENNSKDLEEARKSFNKLVELDKQYEPSPNVKIISELRKDLYEGKNALKDAGNSTQAKVAEETKQTEVQDANKTVSLVVTGQGKTPDEAKQSALRSAIEQAFGAFISSKTEILNDNLVKDEIVSVSNGNIQKFEIISEVELPESVYSSTLKATVSVTKLTTFCEHKGIDIEFKGSLFAANIKTQELYEYNELSIVKNISKVASDIYSRAFDFKLEVSEPVKGSENKYEIKMFVDVFVNDNYKKASEYIVKCLTAISLGEKDVEQYTKLKKPILNLYVLDISGKTLRFYLRNVNSMPYLKNLLVDVNNSIYKFDISPSDLVISTTKKSAQKGFSYIELGSFRNDRNLWYLFTGKCNDDNKMFQTAFLIKNYHEYDLLIKYGYYTGMYDTERNKFPLCNFPYRQEAIRNELGTNNLDLIFSLYNPYKNNYITTHALIQEFTLDKITSISKFTITPKY